MKKEIIISIVVVTIIILLNIVIERHTHEAMDSIITALADTREELINQNEEKMKKGIEKSLDIWNKEKDIFSYYIEHEELEKVETHLLEVKSNVETKEYNIAIQALDTCQFVIEHIKDKYNFALKNIF